MRALVQDRYVTADGAVHIRDIDVPGIADDEVLVRVRAASAKMYGWDLPPLIQSIGRLSARLGTPKAHVPGLDFAGVVEAVGSNVSRFHVGSAVFGWSTGALAEYVAASEDALVSKPANLSFAEAATIAMPGLTALQALRKSRVAPGDAVLIIGASGGVGTFAIQLARAMGAGVTGVCSARNVDFVRSLGAEHTIDYTRSDFAGDGARYDVIIDMAGNRSLTDLRRALRSDGTLVMVGQSAVPPSEQSWFKALNRWLRAALWTLFIDQRLVALIQSRNHDDLLTLRRYIEAGDLVPTVTETHPLSEAPRAMAGLDQGHGRGAVVIEFP